MARAEATIAASAQLDSKPVLDEGPAIAKLTLQVEQLQQQNRQLNTEVENLKKQMAQLVKVVRQRLAATG
jgi:uncharacterized protein YlxW (UPF0749 family)